ncbi:MAG: NAD(P)-dependent oxidoreductase [Gammaproteobacteria bacterium]|nr:NAD(P)-dependent oxidoreductase [Gammaproteobacteria bacterium]
MTQTIGFIGLGGMGLPMAANLAKAGFAVRGYNRTPKSGLPAGLTAVASPAEAAAGGMVLTMVADDAALRAVCDGPQGLFAGLPEGGLHLSMSTISPAASQALAAAHAGRGQGYLAAPVFGRPEAAAAARLWIVAGGPDDAFERAKPVLQAMSQGQFHISRTAESANVVKLGGNFLIAAVLEALGEVYALGRKAGLAPAELLAIYNTALFKSPIYENYGKLAAEQRFTPPGFRLRLGLKDLRLLLQAAEAAEAPMPLASLIHDHMLSGVARGMGELDWAALIQVIADNAGCQN